MSTCVHGMVHIYAFMIIDMALYPQLYIDMLPYMQTLQVGYVDRHVRRHPGFCFGSSGPLPTVPSTSFNILQPAGPGALVLCAPTCSSWTKVARGTTMRSRVNPLGVDYKFVADGNLTISRTGDKGPSK